MAWEAREGARLAFPNAMRGRFVREPAVLRGGIEGKAAFHLRLQARSHPWLYETVGNSYVREKTAERWDGCYHIIRTWQWLNGVPLRDTRVALMVNYVYFEMKRRETGETVYRNSWITDKPVTEENVEHRPRAGGPGGRQETSTTRLSEKCFSTSQYTTYSVYRSLWALYVVVVYLVTDFSDSLNNVLKNRRYNLRYNFGHGKKHASEIFLY